MININKILFYSSLLPVIWGVWTAYKIYVYDPNRAKYILISFFMILLFMLPVIIIDLPNKKNIATAIGVIPTFMAALIVYISLRPGKSLHLMWLLIVGIYLIFPLIYFSTL